MIDEGPLGIPALPVTATEAVRLACDVYDLGRDSDIRATSLPSEYDANFEITVGDGRRFVLKVMHPARDRYPVLARFLSSAGWWP